MSANDRAVDVAVVGAGVAGLAAMRALTDAGLSVCVLEARDRIGGRIYTLHDERISHAIELGAEFVHGSAEELVVLAQEARLTPFTIEGDHWRPRGGRLTHAGLWGEMHKVMRYLPEDGEDESFADFLERSTSLLCRWVQLSPSHRSTRNNLPETAGSKDLLATLPGL